MQENWVSSSKAGNADATDGDCDLQAPLAALHSEQKKNVDATLKRPAASTAFAHLPGKIHFPLFTTSLSTCKCGALNVVGSLEVQPDFSPALFWSVASDTENTSKIELKMIDMNPDCSGRSESEDRLLGRSGLQNVRRRNFW